MSVFLVFKLVFSLIDKEVDERPAGRWVGLVSQDTDYDNSFGLSRILRPLMAPSVVVNVNPVHVFSLIDKEVDGPRSGMGLVMVLVFLFFPTWVTRGVGCGFLRSGQDNGSHPRNS